MIRNLKVLGLALVAVFAMSAVVASAASASTKGWLTSDGPVTLSGTDTVDQKSKFTAFGNQTVECHGEYTIGEVGVTPHGPITITGTNVTALTVTPHYTECTASIGETKAPATVTTNKCDFVLTLGNTVGTGEYEVTADIGCESPTEAIEVHAYTSAAHSSTICTVKVPPQTGLKGGVAKTSLSAGGVHEITLTGPFKNIKATKTGILCGGSAETNAAEQHVHAILSGKNKDGEPTGITITHETE